MTSAPYASLQQVALIRNAGNMVVTGYVSDNKTLSPLNTVKVTTADQSAHTFTDNNGFFSLLIPLPENESQIAQRGTLIFSANGYFTEVKENFDLYPYGDITLKVSMQNGEGTHAGNIFKNRQAEIVLKGENAMLRSTTFTQQPLNTKTAQPVSVSCINSIKVGRACGSGSQCHVCTNGFDVVNFNTYCANVLTNEWGQWGAWPGGMNSLAAGAVAIRTYAVHRIQYPIAAHSNYNICNNTCCHVYNPAIASSSYSIEAIANTLNYILVNPVSGNVVQTEYAAETNDVGSSGCVYPYHGICGDGYFQKSVNGPGLPNPFNCNNGGGCYPAAGPDPLCTGKVLSGHPRGMCQRGSARWATGYTVPSNTVMGTLNGYPPKDWQQMLAYYYPYYSLAAIDPTNTWTGITNDSWHTPENWSCGSVPDENSVVEIPAGTPYSCTVNSQAVCSRLDVLPGAVFTANGNLMIVH